MSTAGLMQTRYRLSVTREEAVVLCDIFRGDRSLIHLPSGSRVRLGAGLWGVMKAHGLISTIGMGHGTVMTVHHDAFDKVQFVVMKRRRLRESRFEDLAEKDYAWKESGSWLRELRAELEGHMVIKEPAPSPDEESPATQAVPAVPVVAPLEESSVVSPSLDFTHIEEMLTARFEEAQKEVARLTDELRPGMVTLRQAEDRVAQLRKDFATLREAQNCLAKK